MERLGDMIAILLLIYI